ncbi:hypothetical protein YOLOSWAG_65 [Erwinia phage vB_EamM_Yoloswag]|uniref:Uncharacterized protein n=1 Tax=Erwinia phage vB_EamM_Yoloswag TaxID=1958956 RepID=A0A1S6L2Z1_9CAUD|nr:hypothetical protein HOR66_gp065 [Erwinia phage vB_EamM_Yoloswag]AQT28548.1 hypothetical protein YOLOSWAG_65 [Erwinia phage vB_EamM_Yoloswag]
MTKAKVVRGAGGRFERVADATDNETIKVEPVSDKKEVPLNIAAHIEQISNDLTAVSANLANHLYMLGVAPYNDIHSGMYEDSESNSASDSISGSDSHFVELRRQAEAIAAENPLCVSAGQVVAYKAIPALCIAVQAVRSYTAESLPNESMVEFLINGRHLSAYDRYNSVVQMFNSLIDQSSVLSNRLIGQELNEDFKPALVESEGLPLISMLKQVRDLLGAAYNLVVSIQNELEVNFG